MSGVLGDFLVLVGPVNIPAETADLSAVAVWPPGLAADVNVQMVSPTRHVHVWSRGDALVIGGSTGGVGLAFEPLAGDSRASAADPVEAVVGTWGREGRFAHEKLNGRYSYVLWNAEGQRVMACTDTFRTCSLFYAKVASGLLIASDIRLIIRSGLLAPRVSLHALYQYLNFAYIPAPLTAIEGISKLPAGYCMNVSQAQVSMHRYWDARYPADIDVPEARRVKQMHETILDTVCSYRCGDAQGWGTFLSGGTDSSSISGILSKAHSSPVNSFSIGFDEVGFDELTYSRMASKHYGLNAHEYRITEEDAVGAIARLTSAYDEPFGNASAIPTFYCTDLAARQGVSMMVAGDGGDEIFGGNERYSKDKILNWYHNAPSPVTALGGSISRMLGGVDFRFAYRIKNFAHRGGLPNPDRFYSDDAFASEHFVELLSADFRSGVRPTEALDLQRSIYAEADADCDLHRLMYLDLKMTIADNDIVKVARAAKLAAVQVVFPYLDRRLVDFTGRLPGSDKVRGLSKRHLFKLAMNDILPEEIRKKKKQGFGLPISVWLRRGGRYASLSADIVLSDRAVSRGYFNMGFVRRLIDRHRRGAWDHSAAIHMLTMLELWHREYIDAHG